MGKQGPCCHCGVTSTPLWRNGPPEKPVLCNACGSRWRTKGSLTNYTPLRTRENMDSEDFEVSKVRNVYFKPRELKSHKKKQRSGVMEFEHEIPYSGQNYRKIFEGDASNRSSSGSAISYSESCAHFGTTDASDLTGSAQSDVLLPSKKRTCVTRPKPSRVEKLTRDLHFIMHEQQSSHLSLSSEEDLLYESEAPMGSVEIGNGGVLIRYIDSKSVEEESEASSLPIDKSYITNEVYSGSASFPVPGENKGMHNSNVRIEKQSTSQVARAHVRRDKVSHEKIDILQDRDSPLSFIDLKDITNFEVFMKCMTHEEQQRLMRFIPSVDFEQPESLRSMLQSPQFMETLSDFQQLLVEGVLDLSFLGVNDEEGRWLRKLVLLNSTKCKWVQQHKSLQVAKRKRIEGAKKIAKGTNFRGYSRLTSLKRPREDPNQHYPDARGAMRSPKRLHKLDDSNLSSVKSSSQLNFTDAGSGLIPDAHDFVENEGACFSPRSMFATPPDRSSMMVPMQFTDESSDQDLLLDVPCNTSFPDAQLLFHRGKTVQNTSPGESREESLSNNPSSSFSGQLQRRW